MSCRIPLGGAMGIVKFAISLLVGRWGGSDGSGFGSVLDGIGGGDAGSGGSGLWILERLRLGRIQELGGGCV